MSRRIEQVNARLQEELSGILVRDIEFEPGVFVTIVSVDTSPDLGHANIFMSVLPFEKSKAALKQLQTAAHQIQKTIFSRVSMEPVPKIHFVLDITEEKAEHIEVILDRVKKEL